MKQSVNERDQEHPKYYELHIPDYHKYANECECAEDDLDINYNTKKSKDVIGTIHLTLLEHKNNKRRNK